MNKFLFVGDVHASSIQYETRLDDTRETVKQKLSYVLGKAKELNVPVIFSGDFLNANGNSTEYLLELIDIFSQFGVPCYNIGGNHECRGTSYASYAKSQVQYFYRAGVMTFLDSNVYDLPVDYGTNSGVIRGYSAYSELNTEKPESVLGLVVHHFLIDSFEDTLICYPDKMKQIFPNLQFILAGHDHAYYPITRTPGGVTIVRPGSLLRKDSGVASDRKPLYAVIDFTDTVPYYGYEAVPAQPFSSLFNLSVKETNKDQAKSIDSFIAKIRSSNSCGMNLQQVFEQQLQLVENLETRNLIKSDLQQFGFIA